MALGCAAITGRDTKYDTIRERDLANALRVSSLQTSRAPHAFMPPSPPTSCSLCHQLIQGVHTLSITVLLFWLRDGTNGHGVLFFFFKHVNECQFTSRKSDSSRLQFWRLLKVNLRRVNVNEGLVFRLIESTSFKTLSGFVTRVLTNMTMKDAAINSWPCH